MSQVQVPYGTRFNNSANSQIGFNGFTFSSLASLMLHLQRSQSLLIELPEIFECTPSMIKFMIITNSYMVLIGLQRLFQTLEMFKLI